MDCRIPIQPARRPKVLIVDDDALVASSLAEFLAAEGYEPLTASDGDAALVEPHPGGPERAIAIT